MRAERPWDALRAEAADAASRVARRAGRAHLMGVAGVGMAALAVQLRARGFAVSGCDAAADPMLAWLAARGIEVLAGHDAAHAAAAEWMICTPAVPASHPERLAARARGIPVSRRGCVLPALLAGTTSVAVAGSHGKTTTTAMVAHILRAGGRRAGFCIGGDAPGLGGVADAGDGATLVVEADESDGTLALYAPDVAVVTNVEMDHADYFRSEEELRACFAAFVGQARRRVVVCLDDPGAREVAGGLARSRGYGFAPGASVRGCDPVEAGGIVRCDLVVDGVAAGGLELRLRGRHNLLNALGAVAAAVELGVTPRDAAEAMLSFRPVRRRFDEFGEAGGVAVISDYAHHPTEIAALLRQARTLGRRLVAVFQPHRYTRTRLLGPSFPPAFDGVAHLVLAPVYAASEAAVPGGASADLFRLIEAHGAYPAELAADLADAWRRAQAQLRPGDVLLVVGAGDVEKIAHRAICALRDGAAAGMNPATGIV